MHARQAVIKPPAGKTKRVNIKKMEHNAVLRASNMRKRMEAAQAV